MLLVETTTFQLLFKIFFKDTFGTYLLDTIVN